MWFIEDKHNKEVDWKDNVDQWKCEMDQWKEQIEERLWGASM